jgi:hypothetical protein
VSLPPQERRPVHDHVEGWRLVLSSVNEQEETLAVGRHLPAVATEGVANCTGASKSAAARPRGLPLATLRPRIKESCG